MPMPVRKHSEEREREKNRIRATLIEALAEHLLDRDRLPPVGARQEAPETEATACPGPRQEPESSRTNTPPEGGESQRFTRMAEEDFAILEAKTPPAATPGKWKQSSRG